MSTLLMRLNRAHQMRRAEWLAKGVIDSGIDLRRIKRETKIRLMPWASAKEIEKIEALVASPPEPTPPLVPEQPPEIVFRPINTTRSNSLAVIDIIAREFGIKRSSILGKARTAHYCTPRHIAMHVMREVLKLSLKEIGRRLNGRDHSTVLNGTKRAKKLIAASEIMARHVELLKCKVFAGRYGCFAWNEM